MIVFKNRITSNENCLNLGANKNTHETEISRVKNQGSTI